MTGIDIIKKHDGMDDQVVGNWMNLWQECADWVFPTNDNINQVRITGQEKPAQRLIDMGIEANFNLASGFFAHFFPPNTVWAKFKHPESKMMDIPAVADYYERVGRIIHNIMVGSNFAQEEFQSLLSIGCFGTSCMSIEEDDKSVVKFRNYIINKVRIAENYQGVIDTISREFELDARQAIQQFGEEALEGADLERILIDAEHSKNTKYKFVHYVSPRTDYKKEKKDAKNKPYASYYVSRDTKQIVKEGGFDYLPYKVARFTTGNDDVYGWSPAMMKLGTFRRSNVIYRSLIVAAEQQVNNQWLVADDDTLAQRTISQRANAIIKYRAGSAGGPPQRLDSNANPAMAKEILDMHDAEVKRMFFNHLFRPLEDYRNMTAWEARERTTTDMMVLTPFVSRYTGEKVTPTMEYVYYLCQKQGKLPPVPVELQDSPEFEIEYVGKLATATKSFETQGAINTLRIFGELGQAVPQLQTAADNVNSDKLFREVWYSDSSSMNALEKPKDVEAIRAERAEKAAQQQQIDNLAPVADAAQKLSGATDPSSIIKQMQGG